MSIRSLNQQASQFFTLQNMEVAPEGPRCIPFTLDFGVNPDGYELDLQNVISRNFVSQIQAIFIDNSANGVAFQVNNPNTGQTIITAPNRQSYKVLLCPNPAKLFFYSAGSANVVKIQLLNFPVTNSDWPAITGA